MKNQQGFATAATLVITIILTMLGFWAVNTGKTAQQISKAGVRYEAVYAAADSELSRLISTLQNTKEEIATGNGATITGDVFTQVWSKADLATAFGDTTIADFSDFNNAAWISPKAIKTSAKSTGAEEMRATYGSIETSAFVQELVSHAIASGGGSETVNKQYLVTVQAYGKNPGDPDGQKNETVVLEAVYQLSFIR